MENPFLNRLGHHLWVGLVILIVVLASYVSLGRLLTANLSGFRTEILQVLNSRLPFAIEAEHVSGQWQSFTPDIVLNGLRISFPGSESPPLELSRGRFGVDVLNSLRTRSLQMNQLVLHDLSLRGVVSSEGVFELVGFSGESSGKAAPLQEFLLNIQRVSLRNNRLLLTLPSGEVRDLELDLELTREGSERRVQATLASSAGARISVLAQGLGDPFSPQSFSGQVYLAMQSTDLGAIGELFADQSLPVWADGAVDLELWLNWVRGNPSLEARLEGSDLIVAAQDGSWNTPLQNVALQARLLERDDRWTLFVSNLAVQSADEEWLLPRLEIDSWGNALQLRAVDVALSPLNTIVTEQEAVPESLREVFDALQLRGQLSALQVRIDNVYEASDQWQVQATFDDLAVDSLLGAPGATHATGYAQIGPGGGFVMLDSQLMTLDFPAIYKEPLHFEDLYGTLNLQWDAEQITLASGLLTTQGEEGRAKVLFSLNIPLQADDIGIEMNLLVGLHDTHPVHRVKYVPYILAPGLLSWLSESIGDGIIEEGAFLWRGSLRQGASPLRTVQLAFNVADTQLRYHPNWPPVLVRKGVVLIDDSNVSVWADQASLFESSVNQLSVETRLNSAGHITLDLRGSIHGPVTDGFEVLNESPLAGIVGPTFSAWTATGDLDTDLQLHMDLTDNSVAPRVDVVTHWHDVTLQVVPGNLGLDSINGEFAYSTETGFSFSGLAGMFWGNPVRAELVQHHDVRTGKYRSAATVLDIELDTTLTMKDLRHWLRLDALEFASGEAAADLNIRIAPRESPLLTVSSELLGVSLDLPAPWKKSQDELRSLRLEVPLSQGVMPLALQLGEQLDMRLNLDAGAVRGGALGIGEFAPPVEESMFRVTGHTPLLQLDEWLAFVQRYSDVADSYESANRVTAKRHEAVMKSKAPTEPDASTTAQNGGPMPFKVAVDGLRADSVVVFEQELRDVELSLVMDRAQWALSLASDWVRGDLSNGTAGEPLRLDVEYLDLDRLPDLKRPEQANDEQGDTSTSSSLALDVNLNNLYQSEQRLGELRFELHSLDDVMTVDSIAGELAKLRVRTEQPAQLVWHRGPESYTDVQINFDFADLGQTLEYFGYERILETVDGSFEIDVRWPDAPQDFSLLQAQGAAQVEIGQGNFLEAPAGATGALRVVSILNLADIVRRLSLSNMFESGIPFDSVRGEIHVGDGALKVPHMDVQGGSRFQFSGAADLQTKNLDGELVATLPVANNLPWIAALAVNLPVAAGVYVVSQVFNKQMNRLSSAVYTIDGSWDDPQVNFDRIFDNKPQTQVEAAAAVGVEKEGASTQSNVSTKALPATQDIAPTDQSASP